MRPRYGRVPLKHDAPVLLQVLEGVGLETEHGGGPVDGPGCVCAAGFVSGDYV